jgi:hypothetical protein
MLTEHKVHHGPTVGRGDGAQRSRSRSGATAVLPWIFIPYDSLTFLLSLDIAATSQTLPLTAVFSVVYLVLRRTNLSLSPSALRVTGWMCLAWLWMFIAGLFSYLVEISVVTDAVVALRPPTFVRQSVSMALGICTLLMFQDSLRRLSLDVAMRWLVIGATPALVVGLVQLGEGAYRLQGTSSEPSHFADYLAFALIPAVILSSFRASLKQLILVVSGLLLLLTYSTTGYIKAVTVIIAYFITKRLFARGLLFTTIICSTGYLWLSLDSENYVQLIFNFISNVYQSTGELASGSLVDRLYGLTGPIAQFSEWRAWVGYGFGGDSVYFNSLFSPEVREIIIETKGVIPSISSLQGKFLLYGGVLGYLAHLISWRTALVSAPVGSMSRAMLPAIFLASLFSLGPIFLPYVWMWLAIATSTSKT